MRSPRTTMKERRDDRRRAQVTAVTPLTATGTVRIGFRVVDGEPFHFDPGQFVGIEAHFGGLGYRRSPYCILTAPAGEPVFDLLVRAVPEGPLSMYSSRCRPATKWTSGARPGAPWSPTTTTIGSWRCSPPAQEHFGDRDAPEEEMQAVLRQRLIDEGTTPEEADKFLADMDRPST